MDLTESQKRTVRAAALRFALRMLQMFGALFTLILFAKTGINPWSLGSAVGTGVITTIDIILFGKEPFGILRNRYSLDSVRPPRRTGSDAGIVRQPRLRELNLRVQVR